MKQKLEQAIALIESAMADIKKSDIIYENAVNNMLRRQLKAAVESIDLCIPDSTPLTTESTKINSVTKSRFLSWYFSESDDAHKMGYDVISSLRDEGEFIITTQDLFDRCGYIPEYICVDDNDGGNEYDPSEVELINGDYNEKRI